MKQDKYKHPSSLAVHVDRFVSLGNASQALWPVRLTWVIPSAGGLVMFSLPFVTNSASQVLRVCEWFLYALLWSVTLTTTGHLHDPHPPHLPYQIKYFYSTSSSLIIWSGMKNRGSPDLTCLSSQSLSSHLPPFPRTSPPTDSLHSPSLYLPQLSPPLHHFRGCRCYPSSYISSFRTTLTCCSAPCYISPVTS